MSTRPRSAPFSTHARGVPLFDRSRFLDIPRHATRALLDLRDIGSSAFWFWSMQSWLTVWSIIVNIISVVFYYFYTYEGSQSVLAVPLDYSLIGFLVVLPLVGFLWIAYLRRDRCLDLLSEAKCLMLGILEAHTEWIHGGSAPQALAAVQEGLGAITAAMHAYFLPARFYSRSYPYLGYKSAMIQIALDRARNQRRIRAAAALLTRAAVDLRVAGLPEALEARLHDRILRLQVTLDQMSNVKEFGTPQGIRSLARFYVCLLIPIFFGPYWAWVGTLSNFAFAFFLSIVVQMALVALLNSAMALEDPYDNNGLDGIFIDEQLYEVEQALVASGATPGFLSGAGGGLGRSNSGPGAAAAASNGAGASVGGAGAGAGAPREGLDVARVVRVNTDTV